MGKLFKFKKAGSVVSSVFLILFGIVFAAAGLFMSLSSGGDYADVQATITEIETEGTGEDTVYTVYVDYTVDGVDYTHVALNGYSSDMREGDIIEVKYDLNDPASARIKGLGIFTLIFVAAGLLAVFFGVLNIVRTSRLKLSDVGVITRTDASKFTQEQVDSVLNNDEERNSYRFHPAGGVTQDFLMEDSYARVVYEARVKKNGFIKDTDFDFINHLTGTTRTVSISFVTGTSVSLGRKQSMHGTYFTINGINNWEYLNDKGFDIVMQMNSILPSYKVSRYGVEIADIEISGIQSKDGRGVLSKLPVQGNYTVSCRASDIDMIFLICFSLSRASVNVSPAGRK